MDDTQRILKCGNLSLHTPGGFFKKRWHAKYLVLYDGSKSGVKRLELFDSEIKFKKQNPAKIIPLVDCVRVVTCQRNKSTYTFEVRTNDQFYLLAAQSFQDMNDWVNCLRLVAFGQQQSSSQQQLKRPLQQTAQQTRQPPPVDILLDQKTSNLSQSQTQRIGSVASAIGGGCPPSVSTETHPVIVTASQAAAAAAVALAKTRQRQPSLLGSCKPQPPGDSPFFATTRPNSTQNTDPATLNSQLDTMTPTVRGQLIVAASQSKPISSSSGNNNNNSINNKSKTLLEAAKKYQANTKSISVPTSLDEEEENMLYCSIEDNPSEHNYRVKVIETELSTRCQLKCYQLMAPNTISQQYEQLGPFNQAKGQFERIPIIENNNKDASPITVTFYQLIVGPQELTLLNDYATGINPILKQQQQQQGLWSWPYQCIRRYGFDKDNCFMFEAGRKCTSGPGQFIVQTPKAYQIYQDVVKFVSELRSLNNTTKADENSIKVDANSNQDILTNKNQVQVQVTQIPVNWTPLIVQQQPKQSVDWPNINEQNQTVDSRQQFFDALRHLDGNANPIKQNFNSQDQALKRNTNEIKTNLTQAIHEPKMEVRVADSDTANNKVNNKTIQVSKKDKTISPEETDESGYEQCDDSVDSSKVGLSKSPTNKNQRHHHNMNVDIKRSVASSDSMSSNASTTSSSGTGSPKHSVGRNSANSLEGLNITRHCQLSEDNSKKPAKRFTSSNLKLEEADFEANLIRDVYSEITKLHAKFAVASGSADDSMSSSCSSSSSSSSSSNSNDFSATNHPDDSRKVAGLVTRKARIQDYEVEVEPMYTNVGVQQLARRNAKRFSDQLDQQLDQVRQARNNTTNQHSNSYSADLLTEPPPINGPQRLGIPPQPYPSTLNPIPEEGRNQGGPKVAPKPSSYFISKQHFTSLTENKSKSLSDVTNSSYNNVDRANKKCSRQLAISKSKLPTNHYVINDVEYAKISRNLRKNLESFL